MLNALETVLLNIHEYCMNIILVQKLSTGNEGNEPASKKPVLLDQV
jgi:hypothetical protein